MNGGGGRGPSLRRPTLVHAADDEALNPSSKMASHRRCRSLVFLLRRDRQRRCLRANSRNVPAEILLAIRRAEKRSTRAAAARLPHPGRRRLRLRAGTYDVGARRGPLGFAKLCRTQQDHSREFSPRGGNHLRPY